MRSINKLRWRKPKTHWPWDVHPIKRFYPFKFNPKPNPLVKGPISIILFCFTIFFKWPHISPTLGCISNDSRPHWPGWWFSQRLISEQRLKNIPQWTISHLLKLYEYLISELRPSIIPEDWQHFDDLWPICHCIERSGRAQNNMARKDTLPGAQGSSFWTRYTHWPDDRVYQVW